MTTVLSANPGQTISLVINASDGYGTTINFAQEVLSVNTNGQVSFTLSQLPVSNNAVAMFVNGVKQLQAIDYIVSNQNITFLNNAFTLRTTDIVDFYYAMSGSAINFVQDILPVNTNGQVLFTLSQLPASNNAVTMFVNGVKQLQAIDYIVSNQNITFLNNAFTLRTTDIVDFYYAINSIENDGYIPSVEKIFYPNGSLAAGYPQPMILLSSGIWKYNITLPSAIIGTFIVLVSFKSTSKTYIQTETFLINTFLPFGNAFISPG